MGEELKEKVKNMLNKSSRKLEAAYDLSKNGFYDDSVSRSYYSMFHAASILLMLKGIESHTHSALVSMFGLHLVRSGEIEKRFGKMLSDTRELRENSDYGVSFEATEEEARLALKNAKEFLEEIKKYLKKSGLI